MTGIDPERPPMRSQLFHIENLESVSAKKLSDRQQRKIRKVLMVNRVELVFLHESHQVWELQSNDAILVEQNLHPTDETVEIRYMGENIVSNDQIGLLSLVRQLACGVLAKETDQRRNCLLDCRLSYIVGRLNSQNWNALGDKELQQIAVIAGN